MTVNGNRTYGSLFLGFKSIDVWEGTSADVPAKKNKEKEEEEKEEEEE